MALVDINERYGVRARGKDQRMNQRKLSGWGGLAWLILGSACR